jgi:hypothetical protein
LVSRAAKGSRLAWQTLNEQLEKIILAYRGLDAFWILSQEQANVMITFLNATYLLKQCITVAYLPHKEWFENQLLLPPSNR